MEDFFLIYLPVSNKDEAKKIARVLLEEKLIICANILGEGESLYWWQGEINESSEGYMLLKAKGDNVLRLEKRIKELHSYDLPAIIKIPALANSEFFN